MIRAPLGSSDPPPPDEDLVPGQAADPVAWRGSLGRIKSLAPARVHFCHHTDVLHGS